MNNKEKLQNDALDILIPLIDHCNDPKTIKPYGIPNEIIQKTMTKLQFLNRGKN